MDLGGIWCAGMQTCAWAGKKKGVVCHPNHTSLFTFLSSAYQNFFNRYQLEVDMTKQLHLQIPELLML